MKIVFFTSMNAKYFLETGRAFLSSWKRHMSKKYELCLYNEDGIRPKNKNMKLMGWNLGTPYEDFQSRWEGTNRRVATFAKKAFSVIHAMENIQADRIVWMDADTVVNSTIPSRLLELICPDDTLSAHFGVKHLKDDKEYFSCETGFFILNKNHPGFDDFYKTYKSIYVNDEYQDLRRFYDGEVYGKTVLKMEELGYKMCELNESYAFKTPIGRSLIAPYVTHYKAGLKDRVDIDEIEKQFENDEV